MQKTYKKQNITIFALKNCQFWQKFNVKMEIKRDKYLQQLIESRQNGFIKVVTGIRRCGKSYLLNVLFYKYLLANGISEDHIIRIDLEDRLNKDLRNPISAQGLQNFLHIPKSEH